MDEDEAEENEQHNFKRCFFPEEIASQSDSTLSSFSPEKFPLQSIRIEDNVDVHALYEWKTEHTFQKTWRSGTKFVQRGFHHQGW